MSKFLLFVCHRWIQMHTDAVAGIVIIYTEESTTRASGAVVLCLSKQQGVIGWLCVANVFA